MIISRLDPFCLRCGEWQVFLLKVTTCLYSKGITVRIKENQTNFLKLDNPVHSIGFSWLKRKFYEQSKLSAWQLFLEINDSNAMYK